MGVEASGSPQLVLMEASKNGARAPRRTSRDSGKRTNLEAIFFGCDQNATDEQ